jgi:translation initiation factor RLI1
MRTARDVAQRLSIRIGNENDLVGSLSGGNQQKVVLGRWLVKARQIYLVDEPAHGVDVGAKAQTMEAASSPFLRKWRRCSRERTAFVGDLGFNAAHRAPGWGNDVCSAEWAKGRGTS